MKKSLAVLTFMLFASAARAEPASPGDRDDAVIALVRELVLAPRAKADGKRKKFSRAMPVPVERRVRVLSAGAEVDARGAQFVRFAVDERPAFPDEDAWQEGRIVGCVYLEARKVFVQRGADYVAASRRGSDAKAQPEVCRSAAHASNAGSGKRF